jgi:phosphoglycerate kinase
MNYLSSLSNDSLRGKRVLLRLDLNVPIENGVVRDDFRIQHSLPTVKKLVDAGAEVRVIAHLGERGAKIAPVAQYLQGFYPQVIVYENLRLESGEEANDVSFAKQLVQDNDLYINEAFSASHREHASIVGVPQFLPACAGLEFQAEVEHLSALLKPQTPLVVVIGGAKFGTKLPLVRRFLEIADHIFIGGALAHPIFKLRGWEIGQSLSDDAAGDLSDLANNPKVVLPSEVLVAQGDKTFVAKPDQVPADGIIVDAGPGALTDLQNIIAGAKTILWNGPLGNYEQGYLQPSQDLAKVIAASSAHSVIGGGDTIAAIESLNIFEKFGFVSAAGGAMLDYLSTGTLPGIEALEASTKKFI